MGKEYCPTCLAHYRNGDEDVPTSSNTYTSGTSGLYVYATLTGERFHLSAASPHLESGASRVTLETALNYGKSPCTTCANIARRTVYATSSSRYYHYSQTCAGSEATPGYLAIARAIGKQPCPVCVQGLSLIHILTPREAALRPGETLQLSAAVIPEWADDLSIAWSSGDERVATVENGLVTAVGAGACEIIATSVNGKYDVCRRTVAE